jgi:uncharacterized protein (TIGR02268 family)
MPQPIFVVTMLLFSSTAAAQLKVLPAAPGVHHIELAEDGAFQGHEVLISPGLATAFRIHGATIDRERTVLEGRERVWVVISDEAILLVPSEQVVPGERLRLTVPFRDGALPASFTLILVVHPALAERQVEIYRQRPPPESLRVEVREMASQLQQCREQVEFLNVDPRQPAGLSGLIATGHMGPRGIPFRDLSESQVPQPGDPLHAHIIRSFRAAKRVAVELWLVLPEGAAPWTAEGVVLRDTAGEELNGLTLWQDSSTTFEKSFLVVVEAAAKQQEAHGTFTLKLWDAGGQRTLTLGNVTFP